MSSQPSLPLPIYVCVTAQLVSAFSTLARIVSYLLLVVSPRLKANFVFVLYSHRGKGTVELDVVGIEIDQLIKSKLMSVCDKRRFQIVAKDRGTNSHFYFWSDMFARTSKKKRDPNWATSAVLIHNEHSVTIEIYRVALTKDNAVSLSLFRRANIQV